MKQNLIKLFTLIAFVIGGMTIQSCNSDACKDVACNDGTCFDGTCICDAGFGGTNCEIELRTAYVGNYNVSEVCNSDPSFTDNFTAEVRISAEGPQYIIITDIYNFGTEAQVRGTVSDTGIEIAAQNFTDSGLDYLRVEGSGSVLDGTSWTLTYTITDTDDNTSDTCITQYTAQ